MKAMKKLATILLAICLAVPCFSMLTFAADGKIMFTDPQTKTGETVEVKGVVKRNENGSLGKIEVTMTYDTTMLKFKSGDGITEATAGTIKYVGDATHDRGETKEFIIVFDVLKAGTTKLEVAEAVIKDVQGNIKDYTKGASTITIAQGEVVTDTPTDAPADVPDSTVTTGEGATVDVDGKQYSIVNEIPENEIPYGYEAATLDYDMGTYNAVYNENTGLYLAYMAGEDNIGRFFMYIEEDATFAPYEEIAISDSMTIALLSDVSEIELPDKYEATTVILNGQEFPAWQNVEEQEFCIIYAINGHGEQCLYQLDNSEGTYQRFTPPEVVKEEVDDSVIGKLSALLENHLDYVILGTGLGFLLFIVIIVILSVKLYNRNAELDEIYDEYGIEDEDDTEDDVLLNLDEDEEDEDYEDDDVSDSVGEMEFLLQEGMKEVFPDEEGAQSEEVVQEEEQVEEVTVSETAEDALVESMGAVVESLPEKEEVSDDEVEEDTLGKALAKQLQEENEESYDDEEDLGDFAVDFIDLGD